MQCQHLKNTVLSTMNWFIEVCFMSLLNIRSYLIFIECRNLFTL